LEPQNIYLIFPVIGSVCGAMLWLNYFIKIDLLEQERTIDILIALIIGFLTPDLALLIYKLHASYAWDFNGIFLDDLFYSIAVLLHGTNARWRQGYAIWQVESQNDHQRYAANNFC
jgi:hypothetical protein